MHRSVTLRRIAGIVGGVVVVMGAWGCSDNLTGARWVDWSGGPNADIPMNGGGPSGPAIMQQTLKLGTGTLDPLSPASGKPGSAVRVPLK